MRSRPLNAAEIEESILAADRTITELVLRDGEQAHCEARWLEKMTQALRLAVVAGVEPGVLTRLHLRLETSLRRASMLLAEQDELPPSQRPTFRPPPGNWPAEEIVTAELLREPADDGRSPPPSQRPTIRPPRSTSAIVPKVNPKKRQIA